MKKVKHRKCTVFVKLSRHVGIFKESESKISLDFPVLQLSRSFYTTSVVVWLLSSVRADVEAGLAQTFNHMQISWINTQFGRKLINRQVNKNSQKSLSPLERQARVQTTMLCPSPHNIIACISLNYKQERKYIYTHLSVAGNVWVLCVNQVYLRNFHLWVD